MRNKLFSLCLIFASTVLCYADIAVTPGTGKTVATTTDATREFQNVVISTSYVNNGSGVPVAIGYQAGGSSVPVSVLGGSLSSNQGTAGTSKWGIDLSTGVSVNSNGQPKLGVDLSTGVQVNTKGGPNLGVDLSTGVQVNTGTKFLSVDFSTGVSVTPPTLTKATQGSTGFSTQDLKDAGRTALSFYVTGSTVGATTVESALQLTKSAGTGGTSNAESFVITSGKTFRITAIAVGTQGNVTATTQTTLFSLRLNTGGSCITTSTPILFKLRTSTPATSLAYDRYYLTIPDGYEIKGDGTIQFCASVNSTFVTNAPVADMQIVGFEY